MPSASTADNTFPEWQSHLWHELQQPGCHVYIRYALRPKTQSSIEHRLGPLWIWAAAKERFGVELITQERTIRWQHSYGQN